MLLLKKKSACLNIQKTNIPKPSSGRTLGCVVPTCLPHRGHRRKAGFTGPECGGVQRAAFKTQSLARGLSATRAFVFGGSHCCPPRALLSSLRNVLSVNTKPPARWHLPAGSSAEPAVLCKLHLQNRELHLTPTAWSHHNQGSVYGRQAPSRLICAPSPSFYKHSAAGVL